MARKRQQIADPRFIGFYRTLTQALDRPDDDPRLTDLADELATYFAQLAYGRARTTSTTATWSPRSQR
nr:hypothetical protein [Streptomyces botrytidirepellens]